jgi:hypothetical protein
MKNDAGDRVGFNKLVVAYSRDIDGRGKSVSEYLAEFVLH